MKVRYIVRAYDGDWYEPLRSIDVIVAAENEPVRTKLLDAAGHPLYRVPTRHPIGFCREEIE